HLVLQREALGCLFALPNRRLAQTDNKAPRYPAESTVMFLWGVRRLKLIGVGCVALAMLVAGLVSLRYFGATPAPPTRTVSGPGLVVSVVFDEMRADYLIRWDDLFDEGGFRRLKREGAWFENCHFPYAATLTAPGHASLATGCSPRKHSIIGNTWYDRFLCQEVHCVYTDHYELVPLIQVVLRIKHRAGERVGLRGVEVDGFGRNAEVFSQRGQLRILAIRRDPERC